MSVDTARLRVVRGAVAFLAAVAAFAMQPTRGLAQGVTTAAMTGVVTDTAGTPLAGAQITAVHTPSGTVYTATTRSDGRYTIPGMRVGGPYRVTAAIVGYRRQVQDNLQTTLGLASDVSFRLSALTVQVEAINVTAQANPLMSSDRTGAATTVQRGVMAALPTISRRVEDMLRLTPQYSPVSFGFSFAGQNDLLNNMTIDGSYFNNSFGLAGQPGDRTGVAAVSLDALEQVQVNVAPYDVRQGNFVGAGINMVTRSGTNDFTGSIFYNERSDSYVGKQAGASTVNPGTFSYHDIGGYLGGPIIRDRLFFFVDYESDSNTQPGTTYQANNGTQTPGGNITRVNSSTLDSLSSYLATNFNYQTGPYQGYSFVTPSTRFLARLDYNISPRSHLNIRYNLLNSNSPILESTSSSVGFGSRNRNLNALNFANSNYAILENIRSVVGEWNTQIGNNMANDVIAGYNSSDESRSNVFPPWFPEVEILNGGSAFTSFGMEPFTPDNQLTYHNYQFQDNFTVYAGAHSLTFGLSYEKYHSLNVFYPGAQSVYVYNSLSDFYTDANCYLANQAAAGSCPSSGVSPRSFQVRYLNISGQTEPVQPLSVNYSGLYAQDQWRPTRELNVTAGIRMDVPTFGDVGFVDNAVADTMHFRNPDGSTVQYNTGSLPGANPLWSPRLGINYDLHNRHTTMIRGGTGLFTGRPAYVWISNQVGNTGVLTGFLSVSGAGTTAYPFNPDPDHYKPAPTNAIPTSFELALVDPNFKFPQVWRSNAAIDQQLPWNLVGSAEYVYTKDVNGIAYKNVNLPAAQGTFAGADNRPRWACGVAGTPACATGQTANRIYGTAANGDIVTDATSLTNEGVGHSWNLSLSLERPFSHGFYAKVAYTTGQSQNTVDPGSIAYGSWTSERITGDPNNPGVGFSQFTPGHRVFAALSYAHNFFGIGNTTLSVFWQGYNYGNGSYTYSGDMNGDGASGNDLIYIPTSTTDTNQIRFQQYTANVNGQVDTFTVAAQQAAFAAFIKQDPYLSTHQGQYMQRNAILLPMVYRADVSISQDIGRSLAGRPNRLQVRLDIFNFMNLISHNSGIGVSFVNTSPLVYKSTTANGYPVYTLVNIGNNLIAHSFQPTASATADTYRFQLGVRYTFD